MNDKANKLLRIGGTTIVRNTITNQGNILTTKYFMVLSLLIPPYDLYYEFPLEEIAEGMEEDVSKQSRLNSEEIQKLIDFLNACLYKINTNQGI